MITIKINNESCDFQPKGAGVTFNYSIDNAQETGSIQGAGTYTVKLPATPRNNRIFGAIWDFSVTLDTTTNDFNALRYANAEVSVDGDLFFTGRCKLLSWSSLEYEVQLIGGNMAWGVAFQTRKLSDVDQVPGDWRNNRWLRIFDICAMDHALNYIDGFVRRDFNNLSGLSAQEMREAFQVATYPIVQYGGNTLSLDGTPAPQIDLQYIRPAYFIAALLFAHFEQEGFRLESTFFTTPGKGQDLAMLHGRKEFISQEIATVSNTAFFAKTDTFSALVFAILFDVDYYFNNIIINNYSSVNPSYNVQIANQSSYSSVSPVDYNVEFRTTFELLLNAAPSSNVYRVIVIVSLWINNTTQLDAQSKELKNAQLGSVVEFDVDLFANQSANNGDFFNVRVSAMYFVSGAAFSATLEINEITAGTMRVSIGQIEGTIFDVRPNLPDITVGELLKALTSMFNLYVFTDEKTSVVYIEPYDDFFTGPAGKDISTSIDRTNPFGQELWSDKFGQTFSWNYAQADNDVYVAEIDDQQGKLFGYDERTSLNLTATDVTETTAEPAQPTRSMSFDDSDPASFDLFVPWLIQDKNQLSLSATPLKDYKTGEFGLRIVRIDKYAELPTTTPYLKINFTAAPTAVYCTGPIGFTGSPAWAAFIGVGVTYGAGSGTPVHKYIRAYFLDPNAPQERQLPFGRIDKANFHTIGASAIGLTQLYWDNWFNSVMRGRIVSATQVLSRFTIHDMIMFRELVVLDKHICIVSEVQKYNPEGDQKVDLTLLLT